MSNDTKNNTMEDMDVLLKKGEIASNIINDPNATLGQKMNAKASFSASVSATVLANKPDSPEVDWDELFRSEEFAHRRAQEQEIEERVESAEKKQFKSITSQLSRVSNDLKEHTTEEHELTRALANKGFQGIENKVDAANEKLEDHITAANEKLEAKVMGALQDFIQASAQKSTRPVDYSDLPVDEVTCSTYDSSAATPFDKEKDEQIASLQNQVKELQRSAKKRLFEDPLKEEEEEEEAATGVPMMKKWRKLGSKLPAAAGFAFGGKK